MISVVPLLIFYLGCYGLTTILVQSKIFKPVRTFFKDTIIGNLLNCMMCTSFWVGLFSVCCLKYSPTLELLFIDESVTDFSFLRLIYSLFFDACSVVAFVWLTYLGQCFIEDHLKREL